MRTPDKHFIWKNASFAVTPFGLEEKYGGLGIPRDELAKLSEDDQLASRCVAHWPYYYPLMLGHSHIRSLSAPPYFEVDHKLAKHVSGKVQDFLEAWFKALDVHRPPGLEQMDMSLTMWYAIGAFRMPLRAAVEREEDSRTA